MVFFDIFMFNHFSIKLAPFVKAKLKLATKTRKLGNIKLEFQHLENAHILGQESIYWHVKVHVLMFFKATRNLKLKEIFGQVIRIVGAITKTVFWLVPQGNTGVTNVSPFKVMPIKSEHQLILDIAKSTR